MPRPSVMLAGLLAASVLLLLLALPAPTTASSQPAASRFVPGKCSRSGSANLKSTFDKDDAEPVAIHVLNNVGHHAHLYWVDYQGREHSQAIMLADDTVQLSSYVGHVWRVRGEGALAAWVFHEFVVTRGPGDTFETSAMSCDNIPADGGAADAPVRARPAADLGALQNLAATTNDDDAASALQAAAGQNEHELPTADDTVTALVAQGCEAAEYLSEVPSMGCHIFCPLKAPVAAEGDNNARSNFVHVAVFVNSLASGLRAISVPANLPASQVAIYVMYKIQRRVTPDFVNRPALYNATGFEIHGDTKMAKVHTLTAGTLLFEGGRWVWPGVRTNHTFIVHNAGARNQSYMMRTISLSPRVFEVLGFLEDGEAPYIIDKARPNLGKSGLAVKDADKGKPVEQFRKSNYFFMNSENDVVLQDIEHRVQMLTRIPISHAEQPQVLRYDSTGFYSAHHDYFDPNDYQTNQHFKTKLANGRNRMCTVFFYLNNVTRGGHTGFPRAGGLPTPSDYRDCTRGVSVSPVKGKVIVFYSLLPSGNLDPLSLHGGCTVEEGEKWSINVWLWNSPAPEYRGSSDFTDTISALLEPVEPESTPHTRDEL